MANIGGLLGTAGGFKGTGVSAPQNPVSQGQLDTAYSGVQGAMTGQQDLLAALQAQQGLQNQSNVYGQLQGVVAGTGPNPAQAMLNQATGQNVTNQAALMAGQRGAASNVGLMARQAAQQGAATQQQAVGQGATLQAQQSLNALGAAGQMATTQAGQQIGQTNANTQSQLQGQQNLLGANAQMNAVNAGLIGATAQQQAAIGGGAMSGAGSALSALAEGGRVGYDTGGTVAPTYNPADKSQGPQSKFGQFLKSWGNNQASDGQSKQQDPLQAGLNSLGKGIGTYIHNHPSTSSSSDPNDPSNAPPIQSSSGMTGLDSEADSGTPAQGDFAKGGKVKALVSPGEKYLTPKDVEKVKKGANPMKVGETIPGKPKVGGAKNSYANDTVKKDLKSGGIIVPRSETKSKDPERSSADFVRKVLSKRSR